MMLQFFVQRRKVEYRIHATTSDLYIALRVYKLPGATWKELWPEKLAMNAGLKVHVK